MGRDRTINIVQLIESEILLLNIASHDEVYG
ncbi:MAG: hypothetical protein FD130_434 [Halothiobacillaceae bacterium]|nr:MAG: hypothetical protein FD130_434 [Halothiobacillaceae bacterium]